jgi:hypothetical protein
LQFKSSFGKKFTEAIKDSEVIMAQIPEKGKSSDEKDAEKKKVPSSPKKFAEHTITKTKETVAEYFDTFGKRGTFGNLASPL